MQLLTFPSSLHTFLYLSPLVLVAVRVSLLSVKMETTVVIIGAGAAGISAGEERRDLHLVCLDCPDTFFCLCRFISMAWTFCHLFVLSCDGLVL